MTASPYASLFTYPRFMALNTEGYPLAGGQLYSYQAGTLTPQATYTDATLTVPNPNPIILDAFGTAAVWLGTSPYKFNLLDVNGVQQADFPIDNVTGLNNLSATLAALASNGAGLIGYASSNNYPAGTVGAGLNNSMTTVAASVAASIVAQTATAFTALGSGSAYSLTPTPALAANAAGVRYNVTFLLSGNGYPSLAVSGLPAMPLVAYNNAGLLMSYQPYLGQVADVQCNGTQWIVLDPITESTTASGRFKNLMITYGQSSGTVSITADEVTVSDLNGHQTRLSSVSVSAALSTVGAINGTDGSTQTAGNFYAVYVAFDPTTGDVGALISSGYPAPTTPITGYTQYFRVGANSIKATGPSCWNPGIQKNFRFQRTVGTYLTGLPAFFSGALGTSSATTPTWGAVAWGTLAPPTQNRLIISVQNAYNNASSNGILVAPNNSYAGPQTTNPPPIALGQSITNCVTADIITESPNFYAATSGVSPAVLSLGWEDNL